MFDGRLPEFCLLVGTFFAVVYGIFTALELRRASGVRHGGRPVGPVPRGVIADVPRYVSQGEAFERNWQGSLGYGSPPDPRAGENMADRLFPSVFFSLRPSRFRDRSYWRFYLVGVVALEAVIFLALPVLAVVLIGSSPASPTTSSFSPTTAQRQALHAGTVVSEPKACPSGRDVRVTPSTGPSPRPTATVSANADGTIYAVSTGTLVAVSSYAGYPPSFDPTTPLCPAVLSEGSGAYVRDGFVATTPGTGFIYFPEPGGSAYVAQIDVTSSAWRSPLPLVALALAVVATDLVLRLRLRKVQS